MESFSKGRIVLVGACAKTSFSCHSNCEQASTLFEQNWPKIGNYLQSPPKSIHGFK